MPLPNAEKKSRRVYALLKTADLDSIHFSEALGPSIKEVGGPIAIEEMSEDELRRLILVNLARLSVKSEWNGLLG
jgi:hypothetical protein